jgi:hypothetical protein
MAAPPAGGTAAACSGDGIGRARVASERHAEVADERRLPVRHIASEGLAGQVHDHT